MQLTSLGKSEVPCVEKHQIVQFIPSPPWSDSDKMTDLTLQPQLSPRLSLALALQQVNWFISFFFACIFRWYCQAFNGILRHRLSRGAGKLVLKSQCHKWHHFSCILISSQAKSRALFRKTGSFEMSTLVLACPSPSLVEERARQKERVEGMNAKKQQESGCPFVFVRGTSRSPFERPLNIQFGLQGACFIKMKNVAPLASNGGITVIYLRFIMSQKAAIQKQSFGFGKDCSVLLLIAAKGYIQPKSNLKV